jgi:hypothetical protein
MKRSPYPGHFNYGEVNHKPHGCRACEHNPMGVCEVIGKELPWIYASNNGEPVWCPLKKKGKKKCKK